MKRVTNLSWKMRLLMLVTFWLLGIVRLAILILPFRFLTPLMGKEMSESSSEIDLEQLTKAVKVGWSVNEASSLTPWESKCLVRAFTTQIILLVLEIPSTLYLGLKKGDSKQLLGHAWLRCGSLTLVGATERENYLSIVQFATLVK